MLNEKRKKVLLIEDDKILCEFLQRYLQNHDYIVEYYHSGDSLPSLLSKSKYELIILDIMLPGKDGIYWLKWLKNYYPSVLTIITSVKANENDRLLGLENGARDYLAKPFHSKELLIRINHIFREEDKSLFISNHEPITINDLIIDFNNHIVKRDDSEEKVLTNLESNILKLLYLNAGSIVSREDIALQVKGTSFHPLDRSIDIHINKIRKKLEKDPAKPEYIKTVRGKGYGFNLPVNHA